MKKKEKKGGKTSGAMKKKSPLQYQIEYGHLSKLNLNLFRTICHLKLSKNLKELVRFI